MRTLLYPKLRSFNYRLTIMKNVTLTTEKIIFDSVVESKIENKPRKREAERVKIVRGKDLVDGF